MKIILVAMMMLTSGAAMAQAPELAATTLPSPVASGRCKVGVVHASATGATMDAARLCARPLAMTIIERPHRPALRT